MAFSLRDYLEGVKDRYQTPGSPGSSFGTQDLYKQKPTLDLGGVMNPFGDKKLGIGDFLRSSALKTKDKLSEFNPESKVGKGFVGLGKNFTDLVQDFTKAPGFAKELLIPGRGFTEEEIKTAKPDAKEKVLAVPRITAEFSNFLGEALGSLVEPGSPLAKFSESKTGNVLADLGKKIEEFGTPKNAEQAAAMRMADVLTILPMGSLKVAKGTAELIAKSTKVEEITKLLRKEVPKMTERQAETLSKIYVNIDNADDVQRTFNKLNLAQQEIEKTAKEYSVIHQGGVIKKTEGEPIKILDDVETFIHKDENGNWVVSEATTGRDVTGGGYENKNFAIKAAERNLNALDKTELQKLISENKLKQPTKTLVKKTEAPVPKIEDIDLPEGVLMKTSKKFEDKPVYEITTDSLIGRDKTGYGELDPERVSFYRKQVQQGKEIEPLRIDIDSEGRLFVEDGKNRLEALRKEGVEFADVVDVTRRASGDLDVKDSLSQSQLSKSEQLSNTGKNLPNQNILETASLNETVPQTPEVHKVFTSEGRQLVDSEGNVVYPRKLERSPNPLEKPTFIDEAKTLIKQDKSIKEALDGVGKKHGDTEEILKYLEKKGVSQEDIDKIVLENGVKLVDTVKVKREPNGVLSAVITKQDLDDIEKKFISNNLNQKWIPTKTAKQKIKEAGRTSKLAILEYYELPQVFFDRTGLSDYFYTPIREAERNAQNLKTTIFEQFEEAGLYKNGSWFTPTRFDLPKTDAEEIGRYYLNRQGKRVDRAVEFEDLSEKSKKFVEIFDDVIKQTEDRFFKVAELNGKNPGKVENYAPIMTNKDFKLSQEVGDMDYIFRKHPAFFSLKKRVEEVPFELYELDYRKVASRWIDQMANFLHLGEVGTQTKYLAQSDEFKELVGDEVWKTTNKWIQDTFNPQIPSSAEKVARFGRKPAAVASLGLNYASVVKQVLTQIPLTIIEKAPPKLDSSFAKHFDIKVSDLPSLRERRGNAAIMDMQEGLTKAFVGPLSGFDKINAQTSLNALLDKQWSKLADKSKELSREMIDYIIKTAQDKLDLWYGGMTRSQLPKAFRTEVGKFINMFIQPLTSQLNGFFYSVAKEKGILKAEKLAEVLAAAVGIAYLEQVITNLSPQWSDEKEMTVDVLSSLAGNIPIVSQIVFAFRSDQPIQASPAISGVSRFASQSAKALNDQADALDVGFAFAEMFGLPKQFRRSVQGIGVINEGGIRDKNGKLLAPVKGTDEQIRSFLRGKYGTIATQDYIRNIGVSSEKRRWFVPEVEFLQNGDYDRKAELFESFDPVTQRQLYRELSEGQQKKLDSAIKNPGDFTKKKQKKEKKSLDEIFGGTKTKRKSLDEIFNKQFHASPEEKNFARTPYSDYEEMIIRNRPEEKQEFISSVPKKTLKGFINDIKDKIPFFESRMGKALKESALDDYPFTPQVKGLLKRETFVRDTSPMFDLATGLTKDDKGLTIGSPRLQYGGVSTEGRLADYLPFGRKILEWDASDGELGIATPLAKMVGPNRIEMKVPDTVTMAHELIHAIVDKRGVSTPPEEFNERWNRLKETDPRLDAVDRILSSSPLYTKVDQWGIMNERMAYLGAMLGRGGVKAFPKEFQEDFRGIFEEGIERTED